MEMWALCYFLYIDHRSTVVMPLGGGGGNGPLADEKSMGGGGVI